MLKGRYIAIVFSVIIHLVIFFLISRTIVTPAVQKSKNTKPIKSFLYIPPKQDEIVAVKSTNEETKPLENEQKPEKPSIAHVESKPEPIAEEKLVKVAETPPAEVAPVKPAAVKIPEKKAVSKYSALKQLNQLRNRLNEKMFEQESIEYSRPKTGSIMHGTPIPTPTSNIPLTPEQKKAKNSTRYGDGLAIIKNDNGTCTIESDLSNVGIEGVTAVSSSLCGESKEKKDFRLHMDKVLKKLGKK